LTVSVEMDSIIDLRKQLNSEENVKVSINDLIVKAASLSCIAVPEANS